MARSIEILLVEDNPADVAFTREALDDARVLNRLHVVEDGADALRFLRREPPFADVPAPDLILLDLNLPRIDGHEVLRTIKSDPELTHLPVIMLTNSIMRADVESAYRSFVNCYIVKPVDRRQFLDAIRNLKRFWVDLVRLPTKDA
jgi:two-component system response regulator